MTAKIDNWEFSDAEINSIASEDLHANRPNRWQGPKSTWRTWTEEERLLWQSMRRIENQDLGVHLYNAHALKRKAKDPATAQDLTVVTEDGTEAIWAPSRSWTAWPVEKRHLPREHFVARAGEDDEFTYRRQDTRYPSSDLREELNAYILRLAKERFRRRLEKHNQASDVRQSIEQDAPLSTPSPEPAALSIKTDPDRESMKLGMEDEDGFPKLSRVLPKDPDLPAVSTNDELSNELLAPSVQHIISKLEKTLIILHHSRASHLVDYSESSDSDSQSGGSQTPSKKPRSRSRTEEATSASETTTTVKRGKGRPRKTASEPTSASESTPARKTNRGRPKKAQVPLKGETREEMLARVARSSHRRLPSAGQPQTTTESIPMRNKPVKDKNAAFEDWFEQGEEDLARRRSMSEFGMTDTEGDQPTRRGGHNLGLRDWSDIVGAAALAGFHPDIIARTAKRCANLFGEGMIMRTLHEVPAGQGSGVETTEYRPSKIEPFSDDDISESDKEDDQEALFQRRIISRQASLAPSNPDAHSPPPNDPTQQEAQPEADSTSQRTRASTPARPRSRSSSAAAGPSAHFCPILTCDRATRGFARKTNLKRHMNRVHPGRDSDGDVDSDEEMVGGVHVDGFLRTIMPGRGWRGEDVGRRKRRRHYRQKVYDIDSEEDIQLPQ